MIKRSDIRTWDYYPIEMPINKDDQGPSSIEDATKMTYEVWDRMFLSHGSHEFLYDAINQAYNLSFPIEENK